MHNAYTLQTETTSRHVHIILRYTHTLSLSLSFTLTLSHSHIFTHSLIVTLSFTLTLSHSHILTHSLIVRSYITLWTRQTIHNFCRTTHDASHTLFKLFGWICVNRIDVSPNIMVRGKKPKFSDISKIVLKTKERKEQQKNRLKNNISRNYQQELFVHSISSCIHKPRRKPKNTNQRNSRILQKFCNFWNPLSEGG